MKFEIDFFEQLHHFKLFVYGVGGFKNQDSLPLNCGAMHDKCECTQKRKSD